MDLIKQLSSNITEKIIERYCNVDKKLIFETVLEELTGYKIESIEKTLAPLNYENQQIASLFVLSKEIEGLSEKSLKYYITILKKFFSVCFSGYKNMTANDIRRYLSLNKKNGLTNVTLDNELRVLKSFFNWLVAEDYISKSPCITIKAIKKDKTIKHCFSEFEIEKMRNNVVDERELALIEFLLSTGARVGEVENLKVSDIDGDRVIINGKGGKQRIVFLNAKAKFAIDKYTKIKLGNTEYVFTSKVSPYNKISKSTIEKLMRNIGERCNIKQCHPHKFRRTMATSALNRGMPIEQIKQLLGHEKIETTTIYARSDLQNVQDSHRKYIV